jgi:uncharacterized protein YecE (DUF72 family)
MAGRVQVNLENFHFRDLHPQVFIGTASDRYAGWLGQIYSNDRYAGRISKRSKIVGGKSVTEETLPVDSVAEYFQHFPVLEIDFTFYRPLLGEGGEPTRNYQLLKNYRRSLKEEDRLILKVPQAITAQRIWKGEQQVENAGYLNPQIFTEQFYQPAVALLGANLKGFVFEQEYQRREDRTPLKEMAQALDRFFQAIPKDDRYHLELRTDLYLRAPVFEVLEKHGVGQVLSHWTWLPPLRKQLAKSDGKFFNRARECLIRLLTPLGMRYEDSYARAYPFNRLVEGMLPPEMVWETVELMWIAREQGLTVYVIINNRAGGNAPLTARLIAERFLARSQPSPKGQMNLW